MAYIPLTPDERLEMLQRIGAPSVESLFEDVPERFRFPDLQIPDGLSELEVLRRMSDLAGRNRHLRQMASFLGAGAYDHYIPSAVGHVLSRNELYTSYTPYQA